VKRKVYPNEEPVQEDVEWCGDEEDVKGRGETALRLHVAFRALEGCVPRRSYEEDSEVLACHGGDLALGDDSHEH